MTMNGIDISSWQSGLNLSNLKGTGLQFVIIKATQGVDYVNPYCDTHYQQAKACGFLRGVYHYARGNDAVAEANYFVNNIKGYVKDAVLCLDWESGYNPIFGSTQANSWIKTFCDHVYELTGVRPLVYIQASALTQVQNIGDYGLWVAQYANSEITGFQDHPWNEGTYTCAIRQYASTGRLNGYSGNLDMDIAYMDETAWHKYANPSGTTVASKPTQSVSTPVKKSNEEIANEVIAGKWGNDPIRTQRLTQAGYDAKAIQTIVNKKCGVNSAPQAVYYVIQSGDNLSTIASKYGTTIANIQKLNSSLIKDVNYIQTGWKIRVK